MGSTNALAAELAADGAAHGTVVLADAQEHGRGRLGRSWSSPPGLNIYMSVILRPEETPALDAAPGLVPLAAGLAALEAIAESTGYRPGLKWPNDIVSTGGRKLGGILLEARSRAGRTGHAILGIGINVNSTDEDFPPELRGLATSIRMETGREHEAEGMIRALMASLERTLALMDRPEVVLESYRAACLSLGREVRAEMPGSGITGRAVDIDALGRLVIEAGGILRPLSSADITHLR